MIHHKKENRAQVRQGEYKIINQESFSYTFNTLNTTVTVPDLADANDQILPFVFASNIYHFFYQIIQAPRLLNCFKYFTFSKISASYQLYHRDANGLVQKVMCSWLRDANCNSCTLNGTVTTQYSPNNTVSSRQVRSAMLYRKHGYHYKWKYKVKAPGRWALQTEELAQLGVTTPINITYLLAFIEGTQPNEGSSIQPLGPFSRTYQPKGFNVYCAPDYYAFTQTVGNQPVLQGQYVLEIKFFVKMKLWNTLERTFNRNLNVTTFKEIKID